MQDDALHHSPFRLKRTAPPAIDYWSIDAKIIVTMTDHVLIIGAGFAGLGMAIRLRQSGIDDFTILERADGVGGVWRDNHYPGVGCDVESHLYSFSFEPNPNWTRQFARRDEILAYLNHCADKYAVRSHIRFNSGAKSARFDESTGIWTVETTDGKTLRARVVVSGSGHALSRPILPSVPGIDSFQGKLFHSARWDHSFPIEGKTVAVIGTGASAIQIVPAIAPKVGRMHLFQRTAPWIVPKPDRAISPRERDRFRRIPILQRLARQSIYVRREAFALGFIVEPRILKLAEHLVRRHIARSVKDPTLRAKLTPSYRLGCKRILPTNDYYPALQRDNVELVTDGIREIRAHSIVTNDGIERPVDAIVCATGFEAAEATSPFEVRGVGGVELNTAWKDGIEAYLGTSVAGFPNMFMIVGPNTGLGHSSMILMIESHVEYVLSAIKTMRAQKLASVDVRAGVQKEYNARLQEKLPRTVWASGCVSWYQTKNGKNTTLWPGFTFEFRWKTRRFEPARYECVAKERDTATTAETPREIPAVASAAE
jgi:cation diffusion facilitator CzcD-associated flavoprotein CzcO